MTRENECSARKAKSRAVVALEKAVQSVGTAEQQLLALHGFLQRDEAQPLVLGLVKAICHNELTTGVKVLENMNEMLSVVHKSTNDAKTFKLPLLMSTATSALPTGKEVNSLARMFGFDRRPFDRLMREAVATRNSIITGQTSRFVQPTKRKSRGIFTTTCRQAQSCTALKATCHLSCLQMKIMSFRMKLK